MEKSPILSSLTTWSMKRGSKDDLCSVGLDGSTDTGPDQRQISRDVLKKQSQTDTEDITLGDHQPIGGGGKGIMQHGQDYIKRQ